MKKIIIGCDEQGLFTIRKFYTVLLLIFFSLHYGQAQTAVKLQNGVYTAVAKERAKTEAKDTGKVFEAKGVKYPIYESKNGKFFIVRTSQKTGQPYNQYLSLN